MANTNDLERQISDLEEESRQFRERMGGSSWAPPNAAGSQYRAPQPVAQSAPAPAPLPTQMPAQSPPVLPGAMPTQAQAPRNAMLASALPGVGAAFARPFQQQPSQPAPRAMPYPQPWRPGPPMPRRF